MYDMKESAIGERVSNLSVSVFCLNNNFPTRCTEYLGSKCLLPCHSSTNSWVINHR